MNFIKLHKNWSHAWRSDSVHWGGSRYLYSAKAPQELLVPTSMVGQSPPRISLLARRFFAIVNLFSWSRSLLLKQDWMAHNSVKRRTVPSYSAALKISTNSRPSTATKELQKMGMQGWNSVFVPWNRVNAFPFRLMQLSRAFCPTEMICICIFLYGSHKPRAATEHFKCDSQLPYQTAQLCTEAKLSPLVAFPAPCYLRSLFYELTQYLPLEKLPHS